MTRLEGLRRIVEELRDVVDERGYCYGTSVLMEIGNRVGLQDTTVRAYLKTLESLRVVMIDQGPPQRGLIGASMRVRMRVRLLHPDAVIGKKNGFFYVEGSEQN